jgi:hypothetical protein
LTASIETYIKVLMFKRSQIEQAISSLLEPALRQPSSGLRTRLKRLLETDRGLACNPRSNDPEKVNYAFFRDAAPGSGFEVWYTEYEAFALLMGLLLMLHNWPQRFAVSILRRVRPALEKEHERILKLDPAALFDQKAIARNRAPGSLAYETTAPAFLAIVSRYGISREQEKGPYACSVHSDPGSANRWVEQTIKGVGGGATMFELTIITHQLAQALARTKPQSRGRTG